MTKRKNNIDLPIRMISLIIGIIGSCFLIVYSFRWEDLGIGVDILGFDISKWFFAFLLVISGIIFSTLIKSALLGKWKLD